MPKHKIHIRTLIKNPILFGLLVIFWLSALTFSLSMMVSAATPVTCPDGFEATIVGSQTVAEVCKDHQTDGADADSAKLGSIGRDVDKAFGGCETGTEQDACGFVDKYINPIINFLAALVGIVVTIMLIAGGIQYSSAGGDPAKVSAAKTKIMNALIALLAFFFIYAGLQWLVPGGGVF
jgi:hypothetical protein